MTSKLIGKLFTNISNKEFSWTRKKKLFCTPASIAIRNATIQFKALNQIVLILQNKLSAGKYFLLAKMLGTKQTMKSTT
jgi:hypothetical protein